MSVATVRPRPALVHSNSCNGWSVRETFGALGLAIRTPVPRHKLEKHNVYVLREFGLAKVTYCNADHTLPKTYGATSEPVLGYYTC